MTPEDFEDLLDRCGGDARAWPPGARSGAERLLARSLEARRALGALQEAERLLAPPPPAAPPGLASRATRATQLPARDAGARWRAGLGWGAAAAVALSLGVATGWMHGAVEDPGSTLAAALSVPAEGLDAG